MKKRSGFTKIPHKLGDILALIDLTERQWRAVWLIIRLTYGCQYKRWAKLKLSDFQAVGIYPSHIREVIDPLVKQKIIVWNKKTKNKVRINEEYLTTKFTKKVKFKLEELYKLIGINLRKETHQSSNKKLTKKVNNNLLKEEVSTSRSGNKKTLPKREISVSKDRRFSTPKDILNKVKYSDRKKIADLNSSKGKTYKGKVNPEFFTPTTDAQYAALKAWQTLEPENPGSFGYYLSTSKKIPSELIYQFVSEIKQDKTIRNKGAVFVRKVEDYLAQKKL